MIGPIGTKRTKHIIIANFNDMFIRVSVYSFVMNKEKIYDENNKEEKEIQIISIWDVINCNVHPQAYHLVSVVPFDEWISMDEIKRRIWDLFQIEYKNDRSLYPYLKTMVDLGIIETNNIGGKTMCVKKRENLLLMSHFD